MFLNSPSLCHSLLPKETKLQSTEPWWHDWIPKTYSTGLPPPASPTGQLLWKTPYASAHAGSHSVCCHPQGWHPRDPGRGLPTTRLTQGRGRPAPNAVSSISSKCGSVGCSRAQHIPQSNKRTFQVGSVNLRVLIWPVQNSSCNSHVAADRWKTAGPNGYV